MPTSDKQKPSCTHATLNSAVIQKGGYSGKNRGESGRPAVAVALCGFTSHHTFRSTAVRSFRAGAAVCAELWRISRVSRVVSCRVGISSSCRALPGSTTAAGHRAPSSGLEGGRSARTVTPEALAGVWLERRATTAYSATTASALRVVFYSLQQRGTERDGS